MDGEEVYVFTNDEAYQHWQQVNRCWLHSWKLVFYELLNIGPFVYSSIICNAVFLRTDGIDFRMESYQTKIRINQHIYMCLMSKEAIDDVVAKGVESSVLEQITSGEHECTTTLRQYSTPVEIILYDPVVAMEVVNDEVISYFSRNF